MNKRFKKTTDVNGNPTNKYNRKTSQVKVAFPCVVEVENPRQEGAVYRMMRALTTLSPDSDVLIATRIVKRFMDSEGTYCQYGVLVWDEGSTYNHPFWNQLGTIPVYRF